MAQVKMGIEVKGLKELLKDLSSYGPAASKAAREESKAIAGDTAERAQRRAVSSGDKLSAAVGVTIRARSDRVPAIVSGGARRLAISGRARGGEAFFGAEFGGGKGKTTRQFRPHKGRQGYFLWPQIREDEQEMIRRWLDAIEKILDNQSMSERWEHAGGDR